LWVAVHLNELASLILFLRMQKYKNHCKCIYTNSWSYLRKKTVAFTILDKAYCFWWSKRSQWSNWHGTQKPYTPTNHVEYHVNLNWWTGGGVEGFLKFFFIRFSLLVASSLSLLFDVIHVFGIFV
jgi:hypothetical protein